MNKFIKTSLILASFITAGICSNSFAQTVATQTLQLKAETCDANMEMVIKDNFIKAKLASAQNRFLQGNIKASHDDFEDMIARAVHDDYVFLSYGMKMAEYGFFDLTEMLFKKLDNNIYTENYVNDIKNFYYPSAFVDPNTSLLLADAYAAITYNNLAMETTSELINNTKIENNDYKYYLIALGYYKSNNLEQALKYINYATEINDKNVNYKILQTKILADSNKPKQALKVLKEINKTEFLTIDFQEKIKAANEYVLYKVAKNEVLKDYHLSYYYHLQGKSLLASKVLQSTVLQAKQYSPKVFALLSKIYYENDEPLKALEFAQRAYREDKHNYIALQTLADINFDERKYEDALKYYKEAKRNTKEIAPSIGIAKTYLAMDNEKKSKKMYEKLLKKHGSNEVLLISSLKVFPQRADDYLAKIVSLDISNNGVWLGLAGAALKDNNLSMAETYLNNSYLIDENNFKYYYYLSQILEAKGEKDKSKQLLIKCSRLNSDYEAGLKTGDGVYEE